MPSIMDFALNMIKNNPSIANNPNAQHYLEVIQNGDATQGEEIAKNLCESYGVSKEDALKQAKSFFHLP